jgi:uncharacterized protein
VSAPALDTRHSAADRSMRACGVLWRPEFAATLDRALADRPVDVVEVMFEDLLGLREIPRGLADLRRRGATILLHGATLSLGGAERPQRRRLEGMARAADLVDAPMVSEHLAYVRSGGFEAWHLLPLARTSETLELLAENIAELASVVDRPLALENIAYLFEWPQDEMDEAEFVRRAVEETGSMLLLDVENVRINAHNYGFAPLEFLRRMPLQRLAYVHVAGGELRHGVYRDTHSEAVPAATLELVEALAALTDVPHAVLERDQNLPGAERISAELRAVDGALSAGLARRNRGRHG